MYLVDANILVYATDRGSKHHDAARNWLDERTAGSLSVRRAAVAYPARLSPASDQPADLLPSGYAGRCLAAR